MTASPTPPSVPITGNLRIWFVPGTPGTPFAGTAAALLAGTAKDITYSLTPTGWRPTITENSISDGRMSQKQVLNGQGNFSEAVEVQYVYGSAALDVANVALLEGTYGFIVVRDSVLNATDPAAAQLVDVYTVQAGKQRKDPPADNALQTKTQSLYVKAVTQRDLALT
jgi:hypothetical protein